jgi:hypothetical protein
MMGTDAAYHENVRARMRSLFRIVRDKLPPDLRGLVEELIEANESGVALEMISEALADGNEHLSQQALADIATLVASMDLSAEVADRLRPLAQNREDASTGAGGDDAT